MGFNFSTIAQFLMNTPWWVYLILFYCIFIGIKCSKDDTSSIYKLFILPLVFGWISVDTLIGSVSINAFSLSVYFIGLLVGVGLGVLQYYLSKVKVDTKKRLVEIPGSWTTLVVILIIFASKYYFGYELASDPHALQNTNFEICFLGISGITTGVFFGRLFFCLFKFF